MRQITLGILFSTFLATSAFAQAPAPTATLDTRDAFRGLSLDTPALAEASAVPAAAAQDMDDAAGPVGLSFSAGADLPTAYYWRGLRQEGDPSLTFQPYFDVGVAASDLVSFNFGSWSSMHTGSNSDDYDGPYYEADFYAGVNVGPVSMTYTNYASPDGAFSDANELAFSAGYDDSASPFPVGPSATVAFGLDEDWRYTYFELGFGPAIPLADAPVGLSVPITLGFGDEDFYEESGFGYFSIGVAVDVPVNDYFGFWGGVSVMAFGDGPTAINDEDNKVIGSFGFGAGF